MLTELAALTLAQLKEYDLTHVQAQRMLTKLKLYSQLPDQLCWQLISSQLLNPTIPFALHEKLYTLTYAQRAKNNPGAAWLPVDPHDFIKDKITDQVNYDPTTKLNLLASVINSNLYKFMQELRITDYAQFHAWSTANYAKYWQHIITKLRIRFAQPYTNIIRLDHGLEQPDWLINAKLNIANSCFPSQLPQHVKMESDAKFITTNSPAIIYCDYTNKIHTISYHALEMLTNRVANSLVKHKFVPGDAIAINMPMTVEAIAIYLGIVKAGCVVVAVADSFAAPGIAERLQIAKAKAIFTQDIILRADKQLPLYTKVIEAQAPFAIVLPATDAKLAGELRPGDIAWQDFIKHDHTPDNDYDFESYHFEAINVSPHQALNILFSSGTTGTPKAIPWDHTSAIKAAADGYLHLDIQPGNVFCWPTNLGWMMGPWLIFATLINRGTIALYYDAPTTKGFTEFVGKAKVNILGVVPSLVKCWRHNNYLEHTFWDDIKLFTSTGETSNSSDMLYLMSRAKYKPIIEYCGGTEISGAYITSTILQANVPAAFSTPAIGLDLTLVNENGEPANPGEVAIIPPSIGLSRELLNADHHQVYYNMPAPSGKTYRRHGDQFERLIGNYYRALGRVDDTMNIGGIKVSSAEIEHCLAALDANLLETAAIAAETKAGGPSFIVIYAVIKNGDSDVSADQLAARVAELKANMQHALNTQLNPLFKIQEVILIDALPRTSSNKVMRRVLRDKYINEHS